MKVTLTYLKGLDDQELLIMYERIVKSDHKTIDHQKSLEFARKEVLRRINRGKILSNMFG